MTQKSCAVGMRNAKLENHLNYTESFTRSDYPFTHFCEIIIQNWIRFNVRGSLKISQPFCRTVSDKQLCRGRVVLSENCTSIVRTGNESHCFSPVYLRWPLRCLGVTCSPNTNDCNNTFLKHFLKLSQQVDSSLACVRVSYCS